MTVRADPPGPGGPPGQPAGEPGLSRVRVGAGAPGDPPDARSYDVVVGTGLLAGGGDLLAGLLREPLAGASRILLVHAAPVRAPARQVARVLIGTGAQVRSHEVPDAEGAKTADVLAGCWAALADAGFTRSDAVVAVGGGAVTDLAGFAAASWLRGVRVVHVPTTVLAMVDAAVGGKTGINLPQGKNLVGAFHPPAAVICDLAVLAGLPGADLRAGLAEVVKAGLIADPVILELVAELARDLPGATDRPAGEAATRGVAGSPVLAELVSRSIAVKARVVTADPRESDLREILNYGHTFGHAIEQVERYSWRHGDAVSVGLVFAAELGRLAGRTPGDLVRTHRDLLRALDLPVTYRGDRWEDLLAAMRRDKKTRAAVLRFVVLDDVARPGRLADPDPGLLRAAYAAVSG